MGMKSEILHGLSRKKRGAKALNVEYYLMGYNAV
jgi:hypothetical protein